MTVFECGFIDNQARELRSSAEIRSERPQPLPNSLPLINIYPGGWGFGVASTEDGQLYAWGINATTLLRRKGTSHGDPDAAEDFTHLHLVADNVRTAAAGFDHLVYVTKAKGEAPSSTCYLVGPRYDTAPVPISLLKPACTIISVAAGEHHTLLLSDGGEIFAIGSNLDGQLGVPSVKHQAGEGFNSTEPVLIPGIAGTAIAAGARHSVCIDRQGRCFAWGSSLHGQCGNAENGTESNQSSVSIAQPSLVEALGPLKCVSIAAGMRHTLCSTSTGDVYGWGSNEDGELACSEPGTTYVSRPRLVDDPALENEHIVKVSACGRHSLALSNSGKVFSWGFGVFGQLGSGKLQASSSTNTASNTCTEIDLPAVGDAVAGWWHSLFLVKDDHVRG